MPNGLTVESIRAKTIVPLQEAGWSNEAIGNYLRGRGRSARANSKWMYLPKDLREQSRADAKIYGKAASQVLRRQ